MAAVSVVLALLFSEVLAGGEIGNWDPPAVNVFPEHGDVVRGKQALADFLADGRRLFLTKFNVLDGAGRPMATGDLTSKRTGRMPSDVLPIPRR